MNLARFASVCQIVSRHAASNARREISGNFRSYQGLVYSAAIFGVSFAFQSPRSRRPSIRANSHSSLSARMMSGNGGNQSLHARNGANIPASCYGLGDLERMGHPNLANGNGHEPIRTLPITFPAGSSDECGAVGRWEHGPEENCPEKAKSATAAVIRNRTGWFAAIAGAMTWLRVSSSCEIADAESVLANAMDQRHGQGRRRSRNSLTTT